MEETVFYDTLRQGLWIAFQISIPKATIRSDALRVTQPKIISFPKATNHHGCTSSSRERVTPYDHMRHADFTFYGIRPTETRKIPGRADSPDMTEVPTWTGFPKATKFSEGNKVFRRQQSFPKATIRSDALRVTQPKIISFHDETPGF